MTTSVGSSTSTSVPTTSTTSSTGTSASTSSSSSTSTTAAQTLAQSNQAAAQSLITSLGAGSGVNVNALAQNLVDAEKVPQQNAINDKINKNDAKVSGYSAIAYVLNEVQTAFVALQNKSNFNVLTASNSDTGALGVTASTSAATGSHTVNIQKIAQAQRSVSAGLASATQSLNSGQAMTISLSMGSNAANIQPTVAISQGVASPVTESSTVNFQNLITGQTVTVAGLTFTASSSMTGAQVASAFSTALSGGTVSGGTFSGSINGFTAGAPNSGSLVFTSTSPNANVSDLQAIGAAGTAASTPTQPTVVTIQGIAAPQTEQATVTFKALSAGQSVTLGGLTFTSTGASTASDVASAFAGMTNASGSQTTSTKGTFTGALNGYTGVDQGNGSVVFTSSTANINVQDLTASSYTGAADVGSIQPGVAITAAVEAANGSAAQPEQATLTFKALAAGQSVTIGGLTYTSTANSTAEDVAAAFAGLTASTTTPANPAKGTFSGNLSAFNAGADQSNGTLTFTGASGATSIQDLSVSSASARITVAAGNDTPQGIVNAINAANSGVTAQLVNTGDGSTNPFQVVLTGPTGAANAFSLSTDYGNGNGSPGVSFPSGTAGNQTAGDATLQVDGINYTRPSNTLTDVIQGLTLNLQTTSSSPALINLTRDTSSITTNVNSLVTAYNDAISMLGVVADPKSTVATYGATLVGDSTVQSIKNQLKSMFFSPSSTPGTNVGALWQMGVSVDQAGALSVDSTKLSAALSSNFSDVVKTFTGNQDNLSTFSKVSGGIANDAIKTLTFLTGNTGPLVTQTQTANDQNTKYQNDLTTLQTRMDSLLTRYQSEFAAMNSLVGNINAEKTSLTTAFAGMMSIYTGKTN
jgi:flagellar hook-associated protein 2